MLETEELLRAVLPPLVTCRGVSNSLAVFDRMTVAEAFDRYVGADLLGTVDNPVALAAQAGSRLRSGESWEDLFFRLLLERVELYGADWPLDEDFLAALGHGLPASAGIALGFDRLAMVAASADRIEQVRWI